MFYLDIAVFKARLQVCRIHLRYLLPLVIGADP